MSKGILISVLLTATLSAVAAGPENLPEYKQTKAGLYLTAKEANELIEKEGDRILFLDVRTRPELMFVGMPSVADANVPFSKMTTPFDWSDEAQMFRMERNPNFINAVEARLKTKGLTRDSKIFLMCRSGGRSAAAADQLKQAGFSQVYSVVDGFEGDSAKSGPNKGKRVVNGWKNSDLPWTNTLDKDKLFSDDER